MEEGFGTRIIPWTMLIVLGVAVLVLLIWFFLDQMGGIGINVTENTSAFPDLSLGILFLAPMANRIKAYIAKR